MGKAAKRRKEMRMKYLAKLAERHPARFENEWEKRLSSWIEQIRKDAGRLKSKKDKTVAPVFGLVEEIMTILKNCGEETYCKYADGF